MLPLTRCDDGLKEGFSTVQSVTCSLNLGSKFLQVLERVFLIAGANFIETLRQFFMSEFVEAKIHPLNDDSEMIQVEFQS